jgi:hypothetical protein
VVNRLGLAGLLMYLDACRFLLRLSEVRAAAEAGENRDPLFGGDE